MKNPETRKNGASQLQKSFDVKVFFILTIFLSILSSGCINHPLAGTRPQSADEVCEWDWSWETARSIGDHKAPPDYTYAVVTLYLKNNAERTITTNPWDWQFIGHGIKYVIDEATFDDTIGHQTVKVNKGKEITTKMVFLVHDTVKAGQLKYNGLHPPLMVRDDSVLAEKLPTFT